MRATSPTNPTESTIDGPIFEPDSGCYMTFWLDIEGIGTGKGSITVYAQNYQTATTSIVYQTPPFMFPLKMFGYTRHMATFSGLTYRFRVLLKGMKTNAQQFEFSKLSLFAKLIYQIYFFSTNSGTLQGFNQSKVPHYLAVDDITFSPQCVQPSIIPTGTPPHVVTVPSSCQVGQFACRTNPVQCIDKSKVCDFNNDCNDGGIGSDEMNCGTCDFNSNSMCGWTNIGQGKQQWSIQPASKFVMKQTIPKVDGANSQTGSYLIIDTSRG